MHRGATYSAGGLPSTAGWSSAQRLRRAQCAPIHWCAEERLLVQEVRCLQRAALWRSLWYWQAVFDGFDGMHAEASSATVAAERVAQLVAEATPVSVR